MMKTLCAALVFTLITAVSMPADAAAAAKKARGRLVHMVSFKFKDGASSADIRKVEEAFAALQDKIPQIATYEAGTNVSPEKLDKGFTHGFLLTFHSAKDRDDYLVHPAHKEFGAMVGAHLADVFVIDFWTHSGPEVGSQGAKPKTRAQP